jgi:hypothetical protein
MGNVQDQDIAGGVPAIVDTGFFNCYAFGNGVESYKIRDSIVGRSFNLGNRVTSVSAQDYKETDRFADMTYSGVYNPETNLNKLNEFNSGLLNYKNLELSFGEIYVLDGRETDVLVLQEDKISYVLAGKNLLSDSAAGGAITSVPEVLGTQIARTEKYGISFNPESYVQWGYDRFFTDAKRGAVLQLQGNSYSNEQLNVISDLNMRTWFRDIFNASFSTQKLGGFDPYMNEYVLVMTDRSLPENPSCLACGTSQVFTLSGDTDQVFCVDLGPLVGITTVSWNVISISSGGEFNIIVNYNGTNFESGFTDVSDSFTFNKDLNYTDIANITIEHSGDIILDLVINCPIAQEMKIVEVVLTNNNDSGQTIHAEYNYTNGTFVGPFQSNLITFATSTSSPIVSWYNIISGYVGDPTFPPAGSTMRLQTNKIGFDDYDFNPLLDKFRYLRSSTLYANNSIDMTAMISASSVAVPISGAATTYHADFTVPAFGEYLYLIWDLRKSIPQQLCYSNVSEASSCCDCTPCEEDCYEITVQAVGVDCAIFIPQGLCGTIRNAPYILNVKEGTTETVCIYRPSHDLGYTILSGNPIITIDNCGCTGCSYVCKSWYVTNTGSSTLDISYTDCKGDLAIATLAAGLSAIICAQSSIIGEGSTFDSYILPYCGCCITLESGCSSWTLYNSDSANDVDFTYLNCSNVLTTVTLNPLEVSIVCARRSREITASAPEGIIVFDDCSCR